MSVEGGTPEASSRTTREDSQAPWSLALISFGIDVALVTLFAALGRSSHSRDATLLGLWTTAWPFLLGLTIMWVSARLWRRPLSPVFAGLSAWLSTVLLGLMTRFLIVGSVAIPFMLVATGVLGIFLVGWRLVAQLILKLRDKP